MSDTIDYVQGHMQVEWDCPACGQINVRERPMNEADACEGCERAVQVATQDAALWRPLHNDGPIYPGNTNREVVLRWSDRTHAIHAANDARALIEERQSDHRPGPIAWAYRDEVMVEPEG